MNPVQTLRACVGVTQQQLALKAGTSQPTIALYESGEKSPTISTLQRLAASLGLELMVSYLPALTREDRRSLAYHRAIAKRLRQNPKPTIQHARQTVSRTIQEHPDAAVLLGRWRDWLDFPVDTLIACMLDPGIDARDMRQVTPFAGLLSAKERMRILKQFRKESAG